MAAATQDEDAPVYSKVHEINLVKLIGGGHRPKVGMRNFAPSGTTSLRESCDIAACAGPCTQRAYLPKVPIRQGAELPGRRQPNRKNPTEFQRAINQARNKRLRRSISALTRNFSVKIYLPRAFVCITRLSLLTDRPRSLMARCRRPRPRVSTAASFHSLAYM